MVLCYGTIYLSILGHYMRLIDLNKKLKNIILECFLMTIMISRDYILVMSNICAGSVNQ